MKILKLTTVFLGALIFFQLHMSAGVSAATAGCYSRSVATTPPTYTKVDCPAPQANTDKCWVGVMTRAGITGLTETDCASFNVSAAGGGSGASGGSGAGLVFDEDVAGKDQCGKGDKQVQVGFNIGCRGNDYPRETLNPIVDMAFAVFRVLSVGVGMVVIGSIIVAGIQYSASRGNPQATQASIKRISSAITALLLYVFMFAIANFIVPGGMFI